MNLPQVFIQCLAEILANGQEVTVRGQKTLELTNVSIPILKPLEHCLVLPHRNDNIFAKIAETLWMLAGRDDIDWLSHYLPRAADYSDNNKIWRGAYGPRLRNWNGVDGKADQLKNIVELLRKDPATRRAVISIWDPARDVCDSKDIPCNLTLHFTIRDGLLGLTIFQRSSDALWGFSGIDAFSWSVLQQMMAHWVGAKIGALHYFITSLHLYERHWVRAKQILDAYMGDIYTTNMINPASGSQFTKPFWQLDVELTHIFKCEKTIRESLNKNGMSPFFIQHSPEPELLDIFMFMLALYNQFLYRPDDGLALRSSLESIPACDYKDAAIEYLVRNNSVLRQELIKEHAWLKDLGLAY